MASKPEPDVVELVRRLHERGKAFSITLEDMDSLSVKDAQTRGHNYVSTIVDGDGDCVKWIEVPGIGLVCIEHRRP